MKIELSMKTKIGPDGVIVCATKQGKISTNQQIKKPQRLIYRKDKSSKDAQFSTAPSKVNKRRIGKL